MKVNPEDPYMALRFPARSNPRLGIRLPIDEQTYGLILAISFGIGYGILIGLILAWA